MATIGELSESLGELTIEWKIKNFSSLSLEVNKCYYSPKFYFSGASWNLRIYPNGEAVFESVGWIGLYIIKCSTGFPVTLELSLSIKTEDEKKKVEWKDSKNFDQKYNGWGIAKCISRSDLLEMKTDLMPSDVLIVICTLKNNKPIVVEGTLFSRYDELSSHMEEIYKEATRTDVALQLNEGNIHAHRIVLEKRSTVFAAMFSHDMKESQTGEISIEDIEKNTMDVILKYLYTGDIKKLTTENVLPIYSAAEKYDIKVIKEMCSEFITRNLSEDWVCDIIKFADLYKDEEILLRAREYFKENARKILKTEKWKTFAKENVEIILELFDTVLLSLLPE